MFSAPVGDDRVRGWLLVFVAMQVIACAVQISNVVGIPASFTAEGRNLQAAVPAYLALVLFQVASAVVQSVAPVVGLFLLFRRSRRTPTFFKVYLSFLILDGVVRMSALAALYPAIAAAFRESGDSLAPLEAAFDDQLFDGFREAGYGGVWLVYWLRSKRIARRFARTGIQHSV